MRRLYPCPVGRLTYVVRRGSLKGEILGEYRHPGPDEPTRGSLLSTDGGVAGGPWRVSDYAQTDASAPSKNVLIVEEIGEE
jgi:hypothetical protein